MKLYFKSILRNRLREKVCSVAKCKAGCTPNSSGASEMRISSSSIFLLCRQSPSVFAKAFQGKFLFVLVSEKWL